MGKQWALGQASACQANTFRRSPQGATGLFSRPSEQTCNRGKTTASCYEQHSFEVNLKYACVRWQPLSPTSVKTVTVLVTCRVPPQWQLQHRWRQQSRLQRQLLVSYCELSAERVQSEHEYFKRQPCEQQQQVQRFRCALYSSVVLCPGRSGVRSFSFPIGQRRVTAQVGKLEQKR